MNKSADSVVVADADDIRRRGEAGEFGRKDTGLGLGYRGIGAGRERVARRQPVPPASPARHRWTAQQEKVVRLYHDMGLSPRQIAERAGRQTPRLGITERLAVQILSAAPRRQPQGMTVAITRRGIVQGAARARAVDSRSICPPFQVM